MVGAHYHLLSCSSRRSIDPSLLLSSYSFSLSLRSAVGACLAVVVAPSLSRFSFFCRQTRHQLQARESGRERLLLPPLLLLQMETWIRESHLSLRHLTLAKRQMRLQAREAGEREMTDATRPPRLARAITRKHWPTLCLLTHAVA